MFLTNDGVSDPRVEKESQALRAAGWEVTVLAWNRTGAAPVAEDRDGVTYERLGPLAPYGGGVRSLPLFRRFWREAASRALELEPTVVHCHDLDTAPAGLSAHKASASGLHLVLDMHELYRDSSMVPQRGALGAVSRTVVRVLERRAFKAADAIVVANPGTLDYYRRFGVNDKTVLVPNAPDHQLFQPSAQPRGDGAGCFVVGYFGQKRYLEGLQLLIDVVADDTSLGAILAGGGTAAADVERLAAGVGRIEVSGRFSYAELPALYRRCDVVYAVYDTALGNVRTLFPVKVMEAMACGLPAIVAEGTWVGDYVNAHGIGIAIPAGDRHALAAALMKLAHDRDSAHELGVVGRRLVEEGLNWGDASARLVETYAQFTST